MTTLISTPSGGGTKVAYVAVTSSARPASQSNPPPMLPPLGVCLGVGAGRRRRCHVENTMRVHLAEVGP
jgi:hypothetical protein